MKKILKNKYSILLIIILLIALFFRTFQIMDRFEFAHDGDLYSWIVKDVVVNHHFRLIGQLTSADGIFIGPFFYYLLIPFFLIAGMDPIGTLIPITILGILTVYSYYWVFAKLFNKEIGLIAAFLQAVLISPVYFDRAVVPSTPTTIWMVWYFYVIVSLVRGDFKVLWILGILIGLIWHIHIALAPALLAVPVAILLSRKFPDKKQLGYFFLILLITSLPLILFETKHHFSQTISFITNFKTSHGGDVGTDKFNLLLIKFGRNINRLFFYPQNLPFINHSLFAVGLFLSSLLLVRKKLLPIKELIVFAVWITGVFVFYTFSSTVISEYYLTNVEVIFMGIVAMWFYQLFKTSNWGKWALFVILTVVLIKNGLFFVNDNIYKKGYNERKEITSYIVRDSKEKGLPCISISYITPPGEGVGFRYFFYLQKLHVNQPKSGSPVYTIVYPIEMAPDDIRYRIEHMGVIPPAKIPAKSELDQSCSGQNSNLTDPLFGYTE